VRGILQNDYGLDLGRVNWVTFDDGHVPEFRDPPNATRAPAGKKLLPMLLAGELDAGMVTAADLKSNPQLKQLIPDPAAAGRAWHARYGALMVNHIVVVKSSLAKSEPWAVREIYRLLKESKQAAAEPLPKDGIDIRPIGYSNNRRNFEVAAEYAWQQRTIPKPLRMEDMFDEVARKLD